MNILSDESFIKRSNEALTFLSINFLAISSRFTLSYALNIEIVLTASDNLSDDINS